MDADNKTLVVVLRGICYFHSETGSEGGYWAFQDERYIYEQGTPNEHWSAQGTHLLKNGDHLTIYDHDRPKKNVWSGTISLRPHPLFTEHASGFWIHADQEGVDRETWATYFFQNYRAELILAS